MPRFLSQALAYTTKAMSSSTTQNKWKGTLPRKVAKDTLTIPGATPATTDLVERLLEQDREEHHCYFGPVPFHNHLSHHILAAYDLGAPPALLQTIYDEEAADAYNIYTKNMKTKEIEKQDVKITTDNWVDYLGKHAYVRLLFIQLDQNSPLIGSTPTISTSSHSRSKRWAQKAHSRSSSTQKQPTQTAHT